MFTPIFNRIKIIKPFIHNKFWGINYYNHIGIKNFESIIESFSKDFIPIKKVIPVLENITSKPKFMDLGTELEEISKNIDLDDINQLKLVVSDNFYRINFNE